MQWQMRRARRGTLRKHGRSGSRRARAQRSPLDPRRLFGSGGGSQDEAARKALQNALEGKDDVLADVERRNLRRQEELRRQQQAEREQLAAGGPGGGGIRGFLRRLSGDGGDDGFRRQRRQQTLTTLKAVGAFAGTLLLFFVWKPLLALPINLIFYIFRIPDGRSELLRPNYGVTAEDDVMSRWGEFDT